MKAFVLTQEDIVVAFPSASCLPTASDQLETIKSEAELALLAASWPTARLVAVWNQLPGVVQVKKFTDRKTGVARIWKAMQALEPIPATAQADTPLPVANPSRMATRKYKGTRKAENATTGKDAADSASKKDVILTLLRRPTGATMAELMAATGWQAHSVRGFLSGSLKKKMGLSVESSKPVNGDRSYSVPLN